MARKKLILTGFMGMGKSTAGRKSAELLDAPYYDTDDWMEAHAGVDIPKLVKTDMSRFRALEAKTLRTILCEDSGIISTGGGIVSTEIGRKALNAANVPVLWLQAPFEVAEKRITQDIGRERPLFSNIDKARALYEERATWYKETADCIVDASKPIDFVVEDIVKIARSIQST